MYSISSPVGFGRNKSLSALVFQIYKELYTYDELLYGYKEQRGLFDMLLEAHWKSDPVAEYCLSEFGYAPFPQDNIKMGLSHINNECVYRKTNLYVVIAAVIGALSGFLAALVSAWPG